MTSDPDVVARAERIVLPGGAFPYCRAALHGVPGLAEAIVEAVRVKRAALHGHLRRHADAGHDGA